MRNGNAAVGPVTGQDAYWPGMVSVVSLRWRRRSVQAAPLLEP